MLKDKVKTLNKELLRPGLGSSTIIKTISWTPETILKANALAVKYGISRSAVIRILVNDFTLDALDKKLQNEENIEKVLLSTS